MRAEDSRLRADHGPDDSRPQPITAGRVSEAPPAVESACWLAPKSASVAREKRPGSGEAASPESGLPRTLPGMASKKDTSDTSRREFLSNVAKVAAGASAASLAGCFPDVGGEWARLTEACMDPNPPAEPAESARVVEVYRADSVLESPTRIQEAAMRPMLEAALQALAQSDKPWPVLLPGVTSATRVGIKVNCLNSYCSTRVPLVKALVDSLKEGIGLDAAHILVWDRTLEELRSCGFTAEAVGATVMGTNDTRTRQGGPGYGPVFCGVVAGKAPRLSRILTDLTDLTINFPVLKTHGISGVTAGLKNIYGIIHNPGQYHTNIGSALPELYGLPPIRKHIRLTLVDALIAVVTGGTSDAADAKPRRILAGTDPIAIDYRALAVVNALRADDSLWKDSRGQPTSLPAVDASLTGWLQRAATLGLGKLSYELTSIAQ